MAGMLQMSWITRGLTICLLGLGLEQTWADQSINWREWAAQSFAEARTKNQLILVNVGHEGCSACLYMEENTFSDPAVIKLINANFVAIQVDSEARPDIGERYSDWAWPANAFMQPDGTQVMAFAGSRRADRYTEILNRLIQGYAAGTLDADQLAPYGAPTALEKTPLVQLRDQIRERQDNAFTGKNSGVFEVAEGLRHFLLRHHIYGDTEALELARATLDGHARQIDPVWGAMFYASFGRWDNAVSEIRMESQAAALQAYAELYQLTGEPGYLNVVENVDRYLTNFMRSKQGVFYANQQERLPNLPTGMSVDDYYDLSADQRRTYGIPTIDHAVYTDVNARVILGYVMAYEATGELSYLDSARQAAIHLLAERQTDTGWMIQFTSNAELAGDKRIHVLTDRPLPYLRTQAHFGLALVALYNATGEPQWQQAAMKLADALLSELQDPQFGGFYGAPDDGTPGRRKPLEDNAAAARFLYLLGILVKEDRFVDAAEAALHASASPIAVRREGKITGNLAMALETLTAGYVEFSVVGEPDDPRTQNLLQAGRQVFEPRKLVHLESIGRYPKREAPAMYICNDERCTLPIFDPAEVPQQAKLFTFETADSQQTK